MAEWKRLLRIGVVGLSDAGPIRAGAVPQALVLDGALAQLRGAAL